MKDFIKKANRFLAKFESTAALILLVIIVFFVFLAAISRYLNFSIVWSLDFTLLLFAWFSFFACSQAMRKKAHIGVTLLVERLPQKVQQFINIFNDILMIAFMVLMVYYSFRVSIINVKQKIYTMGISYSFVTMSLAIGGIFIIFSLIAQFIEHIYIFMGKKTEAEFQVY